MFVSAFLSGFGLAFGLILAIGAQNAFVLRQGIAGAHVLAVVLTCAISDAILIAAGVAGFSGLVDVLPGIADVMRWLGAAFLFVYGALAFRSAWSGGQHLDPAERTRGSLRGAVLTCLALTWLNPHVYLDTVLLIGSVASTFGEASTAFGAGAVTSSFVFFFSLGFGARLLRPVFARPGAWRALDALIGVVMWAIAVGLLQGL